MAASPGIVPYGADHTIYVVVDNLGASAGEQEMRVEHEDLDAVVNGFMVGRFRDPLCVVAFNTLEHWSKDMSGEVAEEIETRCDIEGVAVPDHVKDFLERNIRTLPLRWR